MKLLAIEASTIACSAALLVNGELRERHELAPRRHADLLLPMIGALLAEAGLTPAGLDGIAFGRGPGAFTGVRIATGVTQGIAFGADLPVAPVSTLVALAQGATGRSRRVIAAMDARMNEVYWAVCEVGEDGLVHLCDEERVCAPADAPLPEGDGWFGAGDGFGDIGDVLRQRLGGALAGYDAARWPRAREIALLGEAVFARGEAVSPDQALPVYLRDRVARTRADRAAGGA